MKLSIDKTQMYLQPHQKPILYMNYHSNYTCNKFRRFENFLSPKTCGVLSFYGFFEAGNFMKFMENWFNFIASPSRFQN